MPKEQWDAQGAVRRGRPGSSAAELQRQRKARSSERSEERGEEACCIMRSAERSSEKSEAGSRWMAAECGMTAQGSCAKCSVMLRVQRAVERSIVLPPPSMGSCMPRSAFARRLRPEGEQAHARLFGALAARAKQ